MKQIFGFAASWTLYAIGNAISIPMCRFDLPSLYRPYNWLMSKSIDTQTQSGCRAPGATLHNFHK